MYSTPYKSRKHPPPPSTPGVDDTPIHDLRQLLETTKPDDWKKRCDAVQSLVDTIKDLEEERVELHHEDEHYLPQYWYHQPKLLRSLSIPLSTMLQDGRSTVVKRVTESCVELFDICRGDARYLLKDLQPAILAVQSQTVHVMRHHMQQMMVRILPLVPCKAAMPIWLERLKMDKSPWVRDACASYLTLGLRYWKELPGYLTPDIWTQVGTLLIKSLRDASPQVRMTVKGGLEEIRVDQPTIWQQLVDDPMGPASKDVKIKRYLKRMSTADAQQMEEWSIASRTSITSVRSNRSVSGNSLPSQISVVSGNSGIPPPPPISKLTSITTTTTSNPSSSRRLGPPQRMIPPPSPRISNIPTTPSSSGRRSPTTTMSSGRRSPPSGGIPRYSSARPSPSRQNSAHLSPQRSRRSPSASTTQGTRKTTTTTRSTFASSRGRRAAGSTTESFNGRFNNNNNKKDDDDDDDNDEKMKKENQKSTSFTLGAAAATTTSTATTTSPAIPPSEDDSQDKLRFRAGFEELKRSSSKNLSMSSILQERWQSQRDSKRELMKKNNNTNQQQQEGQDEQGEQEQGEGQQQQQEQQQETTKSTASTAPPPSSHAQEEDEEEHVVIAKQLLKAHERHVDLTMAVLRIELDARKELEANCTEENVLQYFEAVCLGLEHRMEIGTELQQMLDEISGTNKNEKNATTTNNDSKTNGVGVGVARILPSSTRTTTTTSNTKASTSTRNNGKKKDDGNITPASTFSEHEA